MAIFSSTLLISSLSLFHITIAYLLHTAPSTVTRHGTVLLLSSAFELPISPSLTSPSAAVSLLACVLALAGLTDFFGAQLPEEVGMHYWGVQAPVRAAFFFALTSWGWLGGPKGIRALGGATASAGAGVRLGRMSDGVICAWAFMEAMMWFWIYITITDERRAIIMRKAQRMERERERNM